MRFPTTEWSVVLAAKGPRTSDTRTALERLCSTYWYPVYAYIRSRTANAADAEDLTQGLFVSLLDHASLDSVRPGLGQFRAFLLASAKNHMTTEWNRGRARKRGGGPVSLSLDFALGERRYRLEPSNNLDPEAEYERRWAAAMMEAAEEKLRQEFAAAGKAVHFEAFHEYLVDAGSRSRMSYAEIAEALDLTEGAVKTAIHRARRRFGHFLREQIAPTISFNDPLAREQAIETELRHLLSL
jgi:RNA polymerase sigma-70 factor (ECF subfamily)